MTSIGHEKHICFAFMLINNLRTQEESIGGMVEEVILRVINQRESKNRKKYFEELYRSEGYLLWVVVVRIKAIIGV